MVKSLYPGSDREYVKCEINIVDYDTIEVIVAGQAYKITEVPSELIEWLEDHLEYSQCTNYDFPCVHIQCKGAVSFNREYGAAFNVRCTSLWDYIYPLILVIDDDCVYEDECW